MAQLRVRAGQSKGRTFPLMADTTTLGRTGSVRIPDPSVSRVHAQITHVDGVWFVKDCDSRHGTLLSGQLTALAGHLSDSTSRPALPCYDGVKTLFVGDLCGKK